MRTFGKLVVLVAVLTLFMAAGCKKKEEVEEKAEVKQTEVKVEQKAITDMFPENTEALLKFSSAETLYTYFSVTESTVLGQPIEGLEELKGALGFNPFSLEELKTNGFDPSRECGFLVSDIVVEESGEEPNFSVVVFLPTSDAQKAVDVIKASMSKEEAGFTLTEEGDFMIFQQNETQDKLYLVSKNDYLFFAANPTNDPTPFLESLLAGGSSLTKAPAYADVVSKIGADEEIIGYVNLGKIAEKNLAAVKALSKQSATPGQPDMSANLDMLADYEGIGLSLDLGNPNFVLKTVMNMVAESKAVKIMEGTQVNKNAALGLTEHPAVLLAFAMNVAEYYRMILDGLPEEEAAEFQAQLDMVKSTFEIDIENDVINNLAGSLSVGVYDGASITMTNYNALVSLAVKDDAATTALLDKVIATLPPPQQSMISKQPVGDGEAYVVMAGPTQVYVGVQDKLLVATAGKPMFEKALSGKVDAGFTAEMEDKDLADSLKGNANMLYVNVGEVMKAVKNFEMFLPGGQIDPSMQDAVGKFNYLLASAQLEGNSIIGNVTIDTNFSEPFFLEVEKLAKSFQPGAETPEAPPSE